jgi:predicted RNA-binding protein Jag
LEDSVLVIIDRVVWTFLRYLNKNITMDIRNNDIVTRIVVGIVCFAVFIVVLKLTSGPAPSEKKTVSNGEKKATVGKRKETPEPEKKASEKKAPNKAPAAPKDAGVAKASAATPSAPVNAPVATASAPVKAPAAAPEATKKSKETAEERESRKQRQEVAKTAVAVAPAAAAPAKVSPKAAPAPEKVAPAAAPKAAGKAAPAAASKAVAKAAPAAPAAPKPIVVPEEEWEVVGDRRKQKPKKVVEESPKATEDVTPLPKLQIVTETKTLAVDAKKVGALIGPKGVTLRHIQEVTSTLIQIPKSSTPKEGESASDSAKISVTGPAAGVAQAIKMLSDIAAGAPTVAPAAVVAPVTPTAEAVASPQAAPAPPAPVVETVNSVVVVDTKKLGVVIGPKGATFKAIQEATSTIINTTSSKDSAADKTSINVSGLADGVKKAVKAINELASKGYCALLAGENFQESFITIDTK